MENLFTSNGILKKWAHKEQKYCEETISYTNEKIQSLECTIAALNDTNLKLKRVFVQVPDGRKRSRKSRREKESKRKNKKRKLLRKQECKHAVVEALTGQQAAKVVFPISDEEISVSNLDRLKPKVILDGLDQLVCVNGLSVGSATCIQEHLENHSIEWNPFCA